MAPVRGASNAVQPMRSDTRATLLEAIARGRAWLDEIVCGQAPDAACIALRESRSKRYVQMMISLAFLAPDIVRAAFQGRLPRGIGVSQLIDLPSDWARQRTMLGLAPAP